MVTPLSPALAAQAAPAAGAAVGRSLAVSVPPEATVVRPGGVSNIPLRVLNPGSEPVTVNIVGRQVRLGDNGHVQLGSGPDPAWQGRIGFAPGVTTIAAQGYAEVMMTVAVPPALSPDLYFVGFLVSPVPTGKGDVEVINEIGAFVTLDVPGPRDNRLRAELRLPGFTLAKESVGRIEIDNVGRSAVRFWGENDSTAWPGSGTPHQQRFDKSLVPAGHVRSVRVAAKPAWWVGVVTMQVRVIYPATTEAATKEIAFRKRVLVVDPRALVVCGGVLGVAVAAWVRGRRRRRRRLAARARRRGPGTEPSQARRSASKVGAS